MVNPEAVALWKGIAIQKNNKDSRKKNLFHGSVMFGQKIAFCPEPSVQDPYQPFVKI